MIRVTVWNENRHEQEIPAIRKVYPEGIHGCIASFLGQETEFVVRTSTLDAPECGLSQALLDETDVLIYWAHAAHEEVSDEAVARVRDAVHNGMGLIALHSAHYSKVMRLLLGTSMTLSWKDDDSEILYTTCPSHPIAAGIPEKIELPSEEMYGEYFDIPKPDDVIFTGWFRGGCVFRSGVTFTRGNGRIFYFQPGHEAYPIYYQPDIQKIIVNAVRYLAPANRRVGVRDNIAL